MVTIQIGERTRRRRLNCGAAYQWARDTFRGAHFTARGTRLCPADRHQQGGFAYDGTWGDFFTVIRMYSFGVTVRGAKRRRRETPSWQVRRRPNAKHEE